MNAARLDWLKNKRAMNAPMINLSKILTFYLTCFLVRFVLTGLGGRFLPCPATSSMILPYFVNEL